MSLRQYPSLRPHLTAHADGKVSCAAGNVQCNAPRTQSGTGEGEPLPQPVRANRHQIVHQVVTVRYGVEHAAHPAGSSLPGLPG